MKVVIKIIKFVKVIEIYICRRLDDRGFVFDISCVILDVLCGISFLVEF